VRASGIGGVKLLTAPASGLPTPAAVFLTDSVTQIQYSSA
jgi:hypothetical protein